MKPICLDLTRLISRVGRGPWTGIDRVEAAWLDRILEPDIDGYGIIRLRHRYALLDKAGLGPLADRLHGRTPWGRPKLDLLAAKGMNTQHRRAESDARRLAAAVSARATLNGLIACLPEDTIYMNMGHSNFSAQMVAALERHHIPIVALVHDVIPLTHPEYQRPETPAKFKSQIRRVRRHASIVVYNSAATRARTEARFVAWGGAPDSVVAHLGLDRVPPRPETSMRPENRYFVVLGTIEPRKNHQLLLNIWRKLGPNAPTLMIVGQRGWANEEVFEQLDSDHMMGRTVFEYNDLDDATIADLLRGAQALLFPSRAEGYGLPAMEAARFGTPVICEALPVFRELLGTYPVYASLDDQAAWESAIQVLANEDIRPEDRQEHALSPPTWDAHFNAVLREI